MWKYFVNNCAKFLIFGNILLTIGLPQHFQNSKRNLEKFYTIPWDFFITTESPTSKILNDMRNAFLIVSNRSQDINKLIPKMYNMTSAEPMYVFKLPDKSNKLLKMQKSDFAQPTFPNLTKSYMSLMRSPLSTMENQKSTRHEVKQFNSNNKIISSEDQEASVRYNVMTEKNFINYVMSLNDHQSRLGPLEILINSGKTEDQSKDFDRSENSNEWVTLGLEGWQGALSEKQFSEKIKSESRGLLKDDDNKSNGLVEAIYESKIKMIDKQLPFRFEINSNEIWDLPGSISSQPLLPPNNKIVNNKHEARISDFFSSLRKNKTFPLTKPRNVHKNTDVFIARVNDPFGHSTKWSLINATTEQPEDDRKKRGIGELYSMIKCSTGCDPLIYKGYGCYCGFLGSGIPVNGIDKCCKLHDKCYEHSECVSYLEYFVPYIWKCYRGKPLCALDHGEWGGPDSCAARLCQCDLQLSRCLRKFICPRRRAVCTSSAVRTLQNFLMIL